MATCCRLAGTKSLAPDNAVVVRMLYGSEKEAWIEAVTTEFNNQRLESTEGRPIFVEAVPIGSGESLDLIVNGQEQPAVWSPASSILVPIANQQWAAANNGELLTEENPPPVVLSPVVIAMWQPMAEALGWPADPISWADIAEITRSEQTWADFGHPEWGPFQFGHTHPDYSNSGITAILAIAYAATEKTRDLTVADVQHSDVAEFMASVQQGVIHYGRSTGFFGRQMFNRGPAYLSAAVLYENLVAEANNPELYPNLPLPVVAIYPEEGTFWSDHPYAILNGPWMTDELRDASERYRDYLLAPEQQQRALEFGFRPADPGIAIGEPLTMENGVDPTEPQTLLAVPDAEVTQAVRELWGENKKRVEVQVVLDISGSMNDEGRLNSAKQALSTFIGQLADEDELGIITFSDSAAVLTPLDPLGPKREDVLQRVNGLFALGGTRLIDTVAEAYAEMQQFPPGERIRAIVVLSDGADNASSTSPSEIVNLLQADESGRSIKVFTIAYGSGGVDTDLLESISEASGATSYESSSDVQEIEQVYRDIATFF
ncbi:MAG: VWA domain-containing protein [Chloroflexaceae bacterium]|nr:VWA domain-containing protein [Chloroflexaceae bacterium]